MLYRRYLDPTTDFGFKKLFGEEASKPILQSFLFDLLELPSPIVQLDFLPSEQRARTPEERLAIFDVYCQDEQGQRFIVEMQRVQQHYFADRALYYSTFPIVQQAKVGNWDFQLNAVYCVGILNFKFTDNDDRFVHHIGLADLQTQEVFSRKLTFVFVELPKFNLTLDQLDRDRDKWIYLIKHAPELREIPPPLSADPFALAFHRAELARLTELEAYNYEGSLKRARDRYAELQTAFFQGKLEVAQAMIKQQMPMETILQITGLTEEDLQRLVPNGQNGNST